MAFVDLRTFLRGASSPTPQVAGSNGNGDLLIAQGLPAGAEETRKGTRYGTMATSAVGALVVRPSTTAALEIFNNSGAVPFNGSAVAMVIDRLFAHELVTSTTGLGGGAIIYAMVTTPKAAPADAALAINSSSGKSALTKTVITAASTTVADNGWFPWGPTVKKESAGAVVPGGGLTAEVGGRLIVPPGCSLCLHVVSGYAGDTFTNGADWFFEPLIIVS